MSASDIVVEKECAAFQLGVFGFGVLELASEKSATFQIRVGNGTANNNAV
jgi:hypothetical protein